MYKSRAITVCTCVVRCVARKNDRPFRSIAAPWSEAWTPACAACKTRVRLPRGATVSTTIVFAVIESVCSRPRVAHRQTCVVSHNASLSSACAARRRSASPDCSFSREAIVRALQIALQTECYFSGVTEQVEEETMFLEKPVVAVVAAITASEIGVFACPIGKKEPNSGSR